MVFIKPGASFAESEALFSAKIRNQMVCLSLMVDSGCIESLDNTTDKNVNALNLLAKIQIKKSDFEEAKRNLSFVLQIDPYNHGTS